MKSKHKMSMPCSLSSYPSGSSHVWVFHFPFRRVLGDRYKCGISPAENEPRGQWVWVDSVIVSNKDSNAVGSDTARNADSVLHSAVEQDVLVTSSRIPTRLFSSCTANVCSNLMDQCRRWDLCFPKLV